MSLGKSFGSPGGDPTHYNTLHTALGRRGLQALSRGGWELGAGGGEEEGTGDKVFDDGR